MNKKYNILYKIENKVYKFKKNMQKLTFYNL